MSPREAGSPGAVAVCGGGLIGGSVALALRAAGVAVVVADRDTEVRRVLAERDPGLRVEADWRGATSRSPPSHPPPSPTCSG